MVYGDRRPYLVALIVPDTDFAAEWARRRGRSPQSLADDPDFERALAAAVDRVGRQLAVVERVRRFIIAPGGFTVENNMLTPSLKIRRDRKSTRMNSSH